MNTTYILNENCEPVPENDMSVWGAFMEDNDKRRVANTEINGTEISTVFTGIDSTLGGGPPALWETMIFGGEHESFQERYTSMNAAIAGHATAFALVSRGFLDRN